MPRIFGRRVILISENVEKYFKCNDHFQIIGLDDTHPKPPKESIGDFPLLLEYYFDIDDKEKRRLLNDMNVSAHDQFKERLLISSFHQNKVHEIKILLTLFTYSIFHEYNLNSQELAWFTSFSEFGIHWGQKFYTPGEIKFKDDDGFSTPSAPMIPQVDEQTYYQRKFYRFPGQGDAGGEFSLPDNILTLFDTYYALEPEARKAFYQATNLFYQAMDIWHKSRSLSYAALTSSLETLIVYDHRNESLYPCGSCGNTQYHVMENFRTFLGVNKETPDKELKKYVNELYKMRSNILHSGYLLLSDLNTPGHYSFKESYETARMRSLVTLVKLRLIYWLKTVNEK